MDSSHSAKTVKRLPWPSYPIHLRLAALDRAHVGMKPSVSAMTSVRVLRYKTTVKFIHLCRDFTGQKRLKKLAGNLRLPVEVVERCGTEISEIAEFVRSLDIRLHTATDLAGRKTFLGTTLHGHIAGDLRSILILILEGHKYQANMILRHMVESFVITLWGDLASKFHDSFHYLLETKEWKPYRSMQRMLWEQDKSLPNRSIKERLERIRLLNFVHKEGREFYNEYLSSASACDLRLLLSLPICSSCMGKLRGRVNYREFHLSPQIRKQGMEDEHAVYKSDFGFICCFCGRQKLTEGLAMGLPEPSNMLDMLGAISEDKTAQKVGVLRELYSYLSEEYVHFSTAHHPDKIPTRQAFDGTTVRIWGFEGILFCIKLLRPLMDHYFDQLNKSSETLRGSVK